MARIGFMGADGRLFKPSEEYKKIEKKKKEEAPAMVEVSKSEKPLSVEQTVKLEKPEVKQFEAKEPEKKEKQKNKSSNIDYYAQAAKTGAISGTTQAGLAELQEMESGVRAGKNKNTALEIINALSEAGNITNPTNINNMVKWGKKTINDAKDITKVTKKDIEGLGDVAGKTLLTASTLSDLKNPLNVKGAIENYKALKESLNKNTTNKALGIANSVVSDTKDMLDPTHNLAQSTYSVVGSIDKNADDKIKKAREKLAEPAKQEQEKMAKESLKHGKVSNTIAEGIEGITNMLPSIAATTVTKNPNIGMAVMGNTVKGQATEEALEKLLEQGVPYEEAFERARQVGNTKELAEVGTELLSGGLAKVYGKGIADDVVEQVINKKISNPIANFGAKQAVGILGENAEESLSNVLGKIIDKGTVDPNAKVTAEDIYSPWGATTVSTIGINALGGGYGRSAYRQNKAQIIQNLNDAERNALITATQKRKAGQPLDQNDIAAINVINNKQIDPEVQMQNEVNQIQQAVQNGEITPEEGTTAVQNITNSLTPQKQNGLEKNDNLVYNNGINEGESVQNEFRSIQEESRAKLNDKSWGSSSKAADEKLRGRIRGALSEEIKRRGYSDSDNDGLLKLESKGNVFNLHKNVDAETFHDVFEIARAHTDNGELVDLHPIKTNEDSTGYEEMNNYLSEDGMQGFSITKDGDVVSVFNADPLRKGFLRSIQNEINSNGKTLDCYNSSKQRLDEIYSKVFGWKTASIMDHNMEYDHDDIAKTHNNPPVSFMVNPNQLKDDVTDADLNKKFGKDQYGEAFAYRSALMKGGEGNKNDFIFGKDGYFKGMKEGTSDSSFSNEENQIVKSDGNVVTAPIDTKGKNKLANIEINVNNDGGNNNNNNGTDLVKQEDNNNRGDEAQILENYKDRKANKKQPFKEQAAEFMHSVVRGVFDSAEKIVRIGKHHNDTQLNPLYDMTLTAGSTADFNIGGMKDSYQSNLSGEKIGESLENCWKPVEDKDLVRQMNAYLYELHNIDRWNQFNEDGSRKYVFGPEHSDLVSKRNIAKMLEVHPELEDLSKPILNYQRNLLKVLVESGQVSQSHADYLNDIYKNYVPTWRDKDVQSNKTLKNSKGKIDINNPLKEATGSSEDLLPLKEVQAQMTKNVFKTSRTNLFGQQLYKDIGDLNKLKQIALGEINKQYIENNKVDVINQQEFLKEGEKYLDEYLKDFAPNNVPVDIVNGQKTMNVYFNGVKVAMPIDDDIETALKPLKPQNNLAKVTSKVNDFKRGVITQYNPGFSISNALKDAPDAMLNSKYGKEFPIEYAKTVKEMLERGFSKGDQELFNQYCALGGLSNRTFDTFEGFKRDSKFKKTVGFVPNTISDVNDIVEQIPRFTEFKLSLKHGATLAEAMLNAADLTTNFKRGGTLTKKLDAYGTTFLSASTGGFYKQIRNITQQPSGKAFLKFSAKLMTLGLTPAIINSLLYASPFGDEEEKKDAKKAYESLKQYEKDDYLLWYTGDGKFIKIPKGRSVSIPAIMYNAAINKSKGEEVSSKDILNSVMNQIGPNNVLTDNAIISLSQVDLFDKESRGKSWSGSPIESSYMSSKLPGERYDSKTDEFSKWLGKKINVSPKKINYVIQQNTGILGDLLLPPMTPKTTGPNVVSRTTNFLTRRFSTDSVTNNKITDEFYKKQTEYKQNANSSNPKKATEENEIKKVFMNSKSGEIAEKRKEMEEINNDKNISKDKKYKQIRNLQKDINKIAEDALVQSEKVKKEGIYAATVGKDVYARDDYGKWKKETEKTKEKREDLGLSISDYYHYKKGESFTRPDGKTTSIVDGKNAKKNMALVDAFDFEPSEYLEYAYELGQIKADKDSNDESIKGTAKKKKIEYINSLPLSTVQKQMLYSLKVNTSKKERANSQVVQMINDSDLSYDEKQELYNYIYK